MNPAMKWSGAILHWLIGAAMILSGVMKLVGPAPDEKTLELLKSSGLLEDMQLIAVGEIITAVLLILPWTSSLGVLLTSGFWGGAILFHLGPEGGSYLVQSVFLLLTWLGAFLRLPAMFSSFSPDLAKYV